MRKFGFIAILVGFAFLSAHQVSFQASSDIGRLLTEGQGILSGQAEQILHTNYFSYTEPSAPFINHHWLTAVLFYVLSQGLGIAGLNAVYVALGALALWIYLREAAFEVGAGVTGALAALALPMLALRNGLRPEIASVVMLALFLLILRDVRAGRMKLAWLWVLPVAELLWANLHPGFALGPVIFGCYLAGLVIEGRSKELRSWAVPFAVTVISGIANPNGFAGWLLPATVASNYGMPVQENESVFKLQSIGLSVFIEVTFVLFATSALIAWRKRAKTDWGLLLFAAGVGIMSLLFFRIYVFFGGVALVAICANWRATTKEAMPSALAWIGAIVGVLSSMTVLSAGWASAGLDERRGDGDLAAFLRTNNVEGRIFNNYASGGYYIHHFPDRKVFVDSRPEAYTAAFLQNEYLNALKDDGIWNQVVAKYDIRVIGFTQFNANEGQFLVRRFRDPAWVPVFVGATPVLVRRLPEYQSLIDRYGPR